VGEILDGFVEPVGERLLQSSKCVCARDRDVDVSVEEAG
jgi:hypothetical protein